MYRTKADLVENIVDNLGDNEEEEEIALSEGYSSLEAKLMSWKREQLIDFENFIFGRD